MGGLNKVSKGHVRHACESMVVPAFLYAVRRRETSLVAQVQARIIPLQKRVRTHS